MSAAQLGKRGIPREYLEKALKTEGTPVRD